MRRFGAGVAVLALGVLQACGGGGGGTASNAGTNNNGGGSGSSGGTGGSGSVSWTQGVYQPSSSLAARCQSPRSGVDPTTHQAYPDVAGTVADENNWLRSWTHELYLWYSEVPDLNPSLYSTTASYFDLQKTSAMTPTNHPKDRFHFTYTTADWEALSQSGVEVGYGLQWEAVQARPPRKLVVAYTEPGAVAAQPPLNLTRGTSVLTADGVDVVNAGDTTSVNKINAALSPATVGETHTFSVLDPGASTPRTVVLQAISVTHSPVPTVKTLATTNGTVGYLLFNDHLATAEQAMINAISTLKSQNITDLMLDIRYNGGGLLDIASEVAYMIAGAGPTAGQTFELQKFNGNNPTTNPVTGRPIVPLLFLSTTQGFSTTQGQPLPTLNLSRVFILSGPGTCSASESIINSLQGVGVQVILVGSTTCGKPYGFYPQDNCGTTYFSIEFSDVNAKGFGDYPDGFSPANTTPAAGVTVPGCSVADDFSHALGDPAESVLSAALNYRLSGSCPAATGMGVHAEVKHSATASAGADIQVRSPLREMRIFRP